MTIASSGWSGDKLEFCPQVPEFSPLTYKLRLNQISEADVIPQCCPSPTDNPDASLWGAEHYHARGSSHPQCGRQLRRSGCGGSLRARVVGPEVRPHRHGR